MSCSHGILLVIFFFFFLLRFHGARGCDPGDAAALSGFWARLDRKGSALGWTVNDSSTCCSWLGVDCAAAAGEAAARVVGLRLSGEGLKGAVSPDLVSLSALTVLNLSYNLLRGPPPPAIFALPVLEVLDLSSNAFSGPVPANATLPAIKVFNISYNLFKGDQPILAGSPLLQRFDASGNAFTGAVDPGICFGKENLSLIRLSGNNLSGDLPDGLSNCTALAELALDENSLSGNFPDSFFSLTSLKKLTVAGNSLSGTISRRIGDLVQLQHADLSQNGFSGAIPDVFDKLSNLKFFSAGSNILNGTLPLTLSACPTLRSLCLRNNSISSEITLNFTVFPVLNYLDLGSNQLSGQIPAAIADCPALTNLNLARNNLTGTIPSSFSNLTSLTYLSLTGNHFYNLLSALQVLQNLPNLTTVVLTKNFRDGEAMPQDGIVGFKAIEVLVIANCRLTGAVPPWLSGLASLKVLDISWNSLTGLIPPWLGNLENLFYMDLSNNSLTGDIPQSLTGMRSLISSNGSDSIQLRQVFPFFIKRNSTGKGLQYNQVSSFPPSLILADNGLSGPIPPGFGSLVKLQVLDLSRNELSGEIPVELSGMESLETLDLSHNNLNGVIPPALTKLSFLSSFDVSYNNLTGTVPVGGQFSTFSNDRFAGNPDLCLARNASSSCGSTGNPVPMTEFQSSRHNRSGFLIGLAIGIGAAAATLITGVCICVAVARVHGGGKWERHAKAVANAEDGSESTQDSSLVLLFHNDNDDRHELSIGDILKSTNNFDQACIVGCGGFGLVFKATLPDGRRVAIKRLSGDYSQIEREFRAEVETLSRAQHRNLVPLLGYCRSGSDRLLIYSYMENGSLDYWLHEKPDGISGGAAALDWPTRLHIAQGSARGLAYLHLSCEPHILHRDIKSSNILLDEGFEAHLADFGLARLILPYDTHVTTDVVGTLGYIPPEYGQSLVATFKGDVYSFGIVLLELVTGRRPVDMTKPRAARDVVAWVAQMRKEKRDDEVVDAALRGSERWAQVMRVMDIACLCVTESPKARPSSEQLVAWLDDVGRAP